MALKFVQTGYSGSGGAGGGTYDHNLLINRGLPDQHTIESITGLRTSLDKKYEKPFSGIPKTDLAFEVATMHDVNLIRTTDIADLHAELSAIVSEVQEARGGLPRLKNYIDTKVSYSEWSGGGGGSGGGGHVNSEVGYPIYEEHRATQGQTIFTLSKTYRMDTRQLEVIYSGLQMVQDDDYVEVDERTVQFLYPLEQDDLVVFRVRSVINSGLHEEYFATAGQTLFTLNSPYGIGQNILQIFRNGNLVRKGRDYRELDSFNIEFVYPLVKDDYITFHQAGATDPLAGTIMESEIGKVKANLGYTTMSLHDVTQTEKTDYLDMYIDTFITDRSLDQAQSSPYLYIDQSIRVTDINRVYDKQEHFALGTNMETDIQTLRDRIILKNLPGGAEMNTFLSLVQKTSLGLDIQAALSYRTRYNHRLYVYVVDNATHRILNVLIDGTYLLTIQSSEGWMDQLSAAQDSKGNVHLVYREHSLPSEVDRIGYAVIDSSLLQVVTSTVSDLLYTASSPDIDVDPQDTVHIVFTSNRIYNAFMNLEYLRIQDGTLSGLKNITNYNAFSAERPRLAVGADLQVRVVFDTVELNNTTKNIKLIVLEDGFSVHEAFITNSVVEKNHTADIAIDQQNQSHVTWVSERLSATGGIDYCTITSTHIVSTARSIANGTFTAKHPRIAVDYESIAHIVFQGNVVRSDHENVAYAYVYTDGSITPVMSIADQLGQQFMDPEICIYGDTLLVSSVGDFEGYESEKSLANYTGMGRFDLILDSESEASIWKGLGLLTQTVTGTSVMAEYRISEDNVGWSVWQDISDIAISQPVGRYLHIRITLNSSDPKQTPWVNQIQAGFLPSSIEVQSTSKSSTKEVDSVIAIAQYTGDVTFKVSRDGGTTFVEALPETAVNLTAKPIGRDVVIQARIERTASLDAWGILW